MNELVHSLSYEKLSKYAQENPIDYWDKVGKMLYWHKPYSTSIENPNSHKVKWYVGGKLNITYNCLHKAIEEGYGDSMAIIHENINQKIIRRVTYHEMYNKVTQLAGLFKGKFRLYKGDSVLMYMPLIPEGVFVMLACTLLGITYCPVFGGFPAQEVSTRIKCFKPKLIITSNIGYSGESVINYAKVIQEAMVLSDPVHTVPDCLIFNRTDTPPARLQPAQQQRCHIWNDIIHNAIPYSEPEPLDPDHPSFYIFTSGSTGKPKGLVMPTSILLGNEFIRMFKSQHDDTQSKRVWIMSDFGWIVGQTSLTIQCFRARNGTILYEGPLVDKNGYSDIPRVLQWHKVSIWILPPTFAKRIRITCNPAQFQDKMYPHLENMMTGGEILSEDLYKWVKQMFKAPIYSVYGQTEIGGAIVWSIKGYPGGFDTHWDEAIMWDYMRPLPHMKVVVIDEETGQELPPNTTGRIVIKLPVAPSLAATIYGDDNRYYEEYFKEFPGFYDTTDVGQMREDGLFKIQARSNDFLKVSTIKINCGHLETICTDVEGVMDATVIGFNKEKYGEVPFVYIILKSQFKNCGTQKEMEIITECSKLIKERYGDILHFRGGVVISELPLTFTGKKNKSILKNLVNNKDISLQGCKNVETVNQIINALKNAFIIEE